MKLNQEQFTSAGFIFERENGNSLGEFELTTIAESGIENIDSDSLVQIICDGLNNNIYEDIESRISAYWALSKLYRKELLPFFQNRLNLELKNNNIETLFQIMVAIDNLDEPIFNIERDGRCYDEEELNLRDSKEYLNKIKAI